MVGKIFRIIPMMWLLLPLSGFAQSDSLWQERFAAILDAVFADDNLAIDFSHVCYQRTTPDFTVTDSCYSGGHLYVKGDKYEMDYGVLKMLCDGELQVIVEETVQSMTVDSVRFRDREISDSVRLDLYDRVGKPTSVQRWNHSSCPAGRICLVSNMKNGLQSVFVLDNQGKNLIAWADGEPGDFTVYHVDKIADVEENYRFKIELPAEKIRQFGPYSVWDLRFDTIPEDITNPIQNPGQ